MIERTDIPYYVIDPNNDFRMVYVNSAAIKFLGYPQEYLYGKKLIEINPNTTTERLNSQWKDIQQNGVKIYTASASLASGEVVPIEVTMSHLEIDGNEYMAGYTQDIRQRLAMKSELQLLASIVQNSPEFIGISDIEGHAQFLNDAGRKLVGIKDDAHFFSTQVPDYFPDDDRERLANEVMPALVSVGRWTGEINFRNYQTGQKIPVLFDIFRIDDKVTGEPIHFATVTRDLTNTKKAESELQLLASIVQNSKEFIGISDIEGHAQFLNHAGRKLVGIKDDAHFYSTLVPDYFPDGDRERLATEVMPALMSEGRWAGEINFRHYQTGRKIPVWFDIFRIDDKETGEPKNFATVTQDLTNRKKTEAELLLHKNHLENLVEARTMELQKAKEEAENANKEKSRFLSNISHELRTPMHAILGFAETLLRTNLNEKQARFTENILASSQRLTKLLDGLLDLAKLEAGKMIPEFSLNNMDKLIDDSIQMLQSLIDDKRIEISVDCIQSIKAQLDTKLIERVIANLLSNAIKFSAAGGAIEITVSQSLTKINSQDKDALTFTIRDYGVGVPDDELISIFDKFVQSSKTRTKAGGTGLGLPICKEIIDLHHGEIWASQPETNVEKEERTGVCFNFTIPISQE